jgi:hypothetical protein
MLYLIIFVSYQNLRYGYLHIRVISSLNWFCILTSGRSRQLRIPFWPKWSLRISFRKKFSNAIKLKATLALDVAFCFAFFVCKHGLQIRAIVDKKNFRHIRVFIGDRHFSPLPIRFALIAKSVKIIHFV